MVILWYFELFIVVLMINLNFNIIMISKHGLIFFHFHKLHPLGRVGLVVAMSVRSLKKKLRPLIGPQITRSDPGLSLHCVKNH